MTRRSKCGWIAAAILTLLAGAAQDGAQAAVLSGMEPPAPHSCTVRAMFRLPGHTIGRLPGGRLPGVGRSPGPVSKGPLNRTPKGAAGTNATGRTTPGRPPKNSADVAPPRPGGMERGPNGRPSNLVVVPGAIAAVTAFAIVGAGGAPRPPIAPRYTGEAGGQEPAQVAAALLDSKRHRPRELLVEVAGGTSNEVKEALARDYRAEINELGTVELAGVRIWHLTFGPAGNLHETLTALLQDRRVLTAQPNYIYTPVQGPPEKKDVLPGNGVTQAPPAGKQQPSGAGVKLAIIDTCVEGNHDELKGSIASSFSAAGPASRNCKPENHGTAVASLIAGHGKLHGTAERAEILSAQAFSFTSEENEVVATSREIALSMDWAAQTGAQVMNLSFAGPADPLIERVVAAAYRKNIGLIAAAGNAGPASPPLYPAAYPEVIAVTATNGNLELYSAANRGKYISVSARGVDVLAAHIDNSYGIESGTSFAAAEVSGVVAALLEMRPNAGPEEIRAALQNTAAAVPGAEKDAAGAGVVNPAAAVAFVETSLPR